MQQMLADLCLPACASLFLQDKNPAKSAQIMKPMLSVGTLNSQWVSLGVVSGSVIYRIHSTGKREAGGLCAHTSNLEVLSLRVMVRARSPSRAMSCASASASSPHCHVCEKSGSTTTSELSIVSKRVRVHSPPATPDHCQLSALPISHVYRLCL